LLVDQTRYSKLTSSEIVEKQSINYMCIYNFLLHIKEAVKSLERYYCGFSFTYQKLNKYRGFRKELASDTQIDIKKAHLIYKQIKNWECNLFDSEEFG
jgi:hypothetical protein